MFGLDAIYEEGQAAVCAALTESDNTHPLDSEAAQACADGFRDPRSNT